ncbi:hypothetical protein [Sinomonas atrocyanea]
MSTTIAAAFARDPAQEALALLDSAAALAEAPLLRIAEILRTALAPYVRCSALVIFTEDCTGRPQKKAGAEAIISRVTLDELDVIRSSLPDLAPRWSDERIAGASRPVLAARSATNALLVLTDPLAVGDSPEASRGLDPDTRAVLARLWHLAAVRIRDKVAEATPSYLRESRAVSAERSRLTAELTDAHSTTLETVLAALRSAHQSDGAARRAAIDIAAAALVRLRASADRTASLLEEPVVTAFERLRADLRPLERFSGISLQFVEPPVDGRALPGRSPTPRARSCARSCWPWSSRTRCTASASSGAATARTCSSTSGTTARAASRSPRTASGASSSGSRPSTGGCASK